MNDNIKQAKFQLTQPWYGYQRKLRALFEQDPKVNVSDIAQTGEGSYAIEIQVDDGGKAAALEKLLDPSIDFGGVVVNTIIQGCDDCLVASDMDDAALMETAFAGNPLFVKVEAGEQYPVGATYCVFAPVILQFWSDNLNDYQGKISILPADLAQDVLLTDVLCCTDQL